MHVAPTLRAELAKRNIRYTDIAKAFGKTPQAISEKLRRDNANFTANQIEAYGALLGLSASELIARVERNQEEKEQQK